MSGSVDVGLKDEDLDAALPPFAITPRPVFRRHPRASTPFNLRGYRYPGRYPVLSGVPLTFAANVREIWPDGTAGIARPHFRLDRQPEKTRPVYAAKFGIPPHELDLEREAVADAVGAENHRRGRSDEIDAGLARCSRG